MRHFTAYALLATLIVAGARAAEAAERPNILLLVTDDQRSDCLGCTGHPHLRTPHIDRLAAEGVSFDNAFVTTAICSVSRASLMTGRYCRNHRVGDFNTALPPDVLAASLPAQLKKAGYRTGCFGKWGIGGTPPRHLFDVWDAWGGQGEFFHTLDGQRVHNSEFLARRAERFLRGCKPDQPFFLAVLYKSPHEPYEPDPKDMHLFRGLTFPPPKTSSAAYFKTLPEFIRKSEGRTRLLRDCPTPEKYQEFVRQYLRCIASVDRSVGQILSVLDELKQRDNTAIVFTSDNGFFLGEHGMSHKWLMYEESIRVPLIVRPPKLRASAKGTRRQELALNIDIAPTLLDLAGIRNPAGTDGASLQPLWANAAANWRTDFFYEHHFDFGGRIPRTEGVRSGNWKYITYYDVKPAYEDLYDLRRDPREEHNLAGDPAFREQLQEMRARYREYLQSLPPPVRPR